MPLPAFIPIEEFALPIDGVDGAGKTTLADALAPLVAAQRPAGDPRLGG